MNNCSLWVKSALQLFFVNKVLLGHSPSHLIILQGIAPKILYVLSDLHIKGLLFSALEILNKISQRTWKISSKYREINLTPLPHYCISSKVKLAQLYGCLGKLLSLFLSILAASVRIDVQCNSRGLKVERQPSCTWGCCVPLTSSSSPSARLPVMHIICSPLGCTWSVRSLNLALERTLIVRRFS